MSKKDFEDARHAGLDDDRGKRREPPISSGAQRFAFWLCLALILLNLPALLRLISLGG